MGQAKRRGTLKQRIAQAQEREAIKNLTWIPPIRKQPPNVAVIDSIAPSVNILRVAMLAASAIGLHTSFPRQTPIRPKPAKILNLEKESE